MMLEPCTIANTMVYLVPASYTELRHMGMDLGEICTITTAIANHEEEIGRAVSPMTAALILS